MLDHSLDEYYAACHLDSDSDVLSTTSPDDAGIGSWCATSVVVSPLRGRARMLGSQHSASYANIRQNKMHFQGKENNLELCLVGGSQRTLGQTQDQATRREIIRALKKPFSAHVGFATMEKEDIVQCGPLTRLQQAHSLDTEKGSSTSLNKEKVRELLLFDVLCALRQSACKFCVKEAIPDGPFTMNSSKTKLPAVWKFKPEARSQLLSEKGGVPYESALQRLLSIANDIHALQAQLDAFYAQHQRIRTGATVTYSAEAAFFFSKGSIGDHTVHADRAIGWTALHTLLRFAELVSAWMQEFKVWVFRLQEELMGHPGSCEPLAPSMNGTAMMGRCVSDIDPASCEVPCAPPPPIEDRMRGLVNSHLQPSQQGPTQGVKKMHKTEEIFSGTLLRAHSVNTRFVFLDDLCLLQVVGAVERNAILLQRCLVIINESDCFHVFQTKFDSSCGVATRDGNSEKDNEEAAPGQPPLNTSAMELAFLIECTEPGATLLDYLIIQLSALQHPGAMDLYRLYMSLLIHCAWPYVILSTTAIFGFVHGIDTQKWRQQLPRLFRSSFSHIRVGGAHRRFPTDVLSLILSCVDYQKSAVSLEPFKTLSMLSSARRFILHSLQAFAKRKCKNQSVKDHGERQNASIGPNTVQPPEEPSNLAPATSTWTSLRSTSEKLAAGIRHNSLNCQSGPAFEGKTEDKGQMENRLQTKLRSQGLLQQPVGCSWVPFKREGDRFPSPGQHLEFLLESPEALPLCLTTVESDALAFRHSVGVSEVVREGWKGSEGIAQPHRRGSVWCLQVCDSKTSPELLLSKTWPCKRMGDIDIWEGVGGSSEEDRQDIYKSLLWLDKAMPAARWIAAALLIPIGVVVQQLQQQRAGRLFRGLGSTSSPIGLSKASQRAPEPHIVWPDNQEDNMLDSEAPFENYLESGKAQLVNSGAIARCQTGLDMTPSSIPRSLVSLNFADALDLLLDVALCRDKECILERFLERLYVEPRWWQRTSTCKNSHGRGRDDAGPTGGTTSTLISSLFTEALRGRRHGNLVQLCVLPKRGKIPAREKVKSDAASKDADPRAKAVVGADGESLLAYEMLDVFESFQLIFHFPEELELILLPRRLSVRLGSEVGIVESTYATLFWGKRRGGVPDSGWHDNKQVHQDPTMSITKPGQRVGDRYTKPKDVWSCAFGYMCALHFAQITLREHRKSLHIRDTQDRQLLSVLGRPLASATPHTTATNTGGHIHSDANSLRFVARSLGSSYFFLCFAVDTLLTFTQREVAIAIYKLEHLLKRTEALNSAMQLCQELDTVLVGVDHMCFLAGTSATSPHGNPLHGDDQRATGSDTEIDARLTLRAHIHTILSLALDPSRMPPKFLGTRTRNAIEALVALVSALQDFSLLKNRLRPLLVLLTFNNFFGSDNCISFQFR